MCCSKRATREDRLRRIFSVFDVDGDGVISKEDLELMVRQLAGSSFTCAPPARAPAPCPYPDAEQKCLGLKWLCVSCVYFKLRLVCFSVAPLLERSCCMLASKSTHRVQYLLLLLLAKSFTSRLSEQVHELAGGAEQGRAGAGGCWMWRFRTAVATA